MKTQYTVQQLVAAIVGKTDLRPTMIRQYPTLAMALLDNAAEGVLAGLAQMPAKQLERLLRTDRVQKTPRTPATATEGKRPRGRPRKVAMPVESTPDHPPKKRLVKKEVAKEVAKSKKSKRTDEQDD